MLRNKIRYLLFLACAGLLLILFNRYYIGIIFLTILVLPFVLFGLLCYCYGNIRVELVSSAHIVNKGDKIPVTVQLSNPTIFPVACIKLYLVYRNTYSKKKFKKTVWASLDCRSKASVILHITSQYAGNMEITLEGFRIYDYMKLFSLKRKIQSNVRVAVLPSYYELENYEIVNNSTRIMESDHYSPINKGDDPSEVFEIREYREGDRLQRIHWKLSIKQRQLMIKEFSDPVSCSTLIFVNLNIPEGDQTLCCIDSILECTLSLSYTYLMKGQIHYLSWYDTEHKECRRVRVTQEKDLFEAVDGLLHTQPYTEVFDAVTAYQAQYPHDRYSNLILISADISDMMADSLAAIKADLRKMIYMRNISNKYDKTVDTELLQKYKETGIELLSVDADNIQGGMEQPGMAF